MAGSIAARSVARTAELSNGGLCVFTYSSNRRYEGYFSTFTLEGSDDRLAAGKECMIPSTLPFSSSSCCVLMSGVIFRRTFWKNGFGPHQFS